MTHLQVNQNREYNWAAYLRHLCSLTNIMKIQGIRVKFSNKITQNESIPDALTKMDQFWIWRKLIAPQDFKSVEPINTLSPQRNTLQDSSHIM